MSPRSGTGCGLLLAVSLLFTTAAFAARSAQDAAHPPPPGSGPSGEPIHRDFVVYFGSGSADFDAEAERLLKDAGEYIVGSGPVRVSIVGFADRAGDASYNDRLSERRARAVADRLILLGVDTSWLSVEWKGEREPQAPTDDGQGEVLNRRVLVMLRR